MNTQIHPVLTKITKRITKRSKSSRIAYLDMVKTRRSDNNDNQSAREGLSPGNQAHIYAGCALHDKQALMGARWPNIGII